MSESTPSRITRLLEPTLILTAVTAFAAYVGMQWLAGFYGAFGIDYHDLDLPFAELISASVGPLLFALWIAADAFTAAADEGRTRAAVARSYSAPLLFLFLIAALDGTWSAFYVSALGGAVVAIALFTALKLPFIGLFSDRPPILRYAPVAGLFVLVCLFASTLGKNSARRLMVTFEKQVTWQVRCLIPFPNDSVAMLHHGPVFTVFVQKTDKDSFHTLWVRNDQITAMESTVQKL